MWAELEAFEQHPMVQMMQGTKTTLLFIEFYHNKTFYVFNLSTKRLTKMVITA